MDLSTLEQSLSVVFIPPWFQMQFAKYDVSLSSGSLAFWLEGMCWRIMLFFFFCAGLHKDIMINIPGTAFMTNWRIIKGERDSFCNMCRGMQR